MGGGPRGDEPEVPTSEKEEFIFLINSSIYLSTDSSNNEEDEEEGNVMTSSSDPTVVEPFVRRVSKRSK